MPRDKEKEWAEKQDRIRATQLKRDTLRAGIEKETCDASGASTSKSMRPIDDVINRIRYDSGLVAADFTIGYLDRFLGLCEAGFPTFMTHVDFEDVPRHRIKYVRFLTEVVWDRRNDTPNGAFDHFFGSAISQAATTAAATAQSKPATNIEKFLERRDALLKHIADAEAAKAAAQKEAEIIEMKKVDAIRSDIAAQRSALLSKVDTAVVATVTGNAVAAFDVKSASALSPSNGRKRKGSNAGMSDRSDDNDSADEPRNLSAKLKGKAKVPSNRPTHFVALRITSAPVITHVQSVQKHILSLHPSYAEAAIPLPTLHVTCGLMHLQNKEDVDRCVAALQACRSEVASLIAGHSVSFAGLQTFNDKVLYVPIDGAPVASTASTASTAPSASAAPATAQSNAAAGRQALCSVWELVSRRLSRAGVHVIDDTKKGSHSATGFEPHLTVLKLSRFGKSKSKSANQQRKQQKKKEQKEDSRHARKQIKMLTKELKQIEHKMERSALSLPMDATTATTAPAVQNADGKTAAAPATSLRAEHTRLANTIAALQSVVDTHNPAAPQKTHSLPPAFLTAIPVECYQPFLSTVAGTQRLQLSQFSLCSMTAPKAADGFYHSVYNFAAPDTSHSTPSAAPSAAPSFTPAPTAAPQPQSLR